MTDDDDVIVIGSGAGGGRSPTPAPHPRPGSARGTRWPTTLLDRLGLAVPAREAPAPAVRAGRAMIGEATAAPSVPGASSCPRFMGDCGSLDRADGADAGDGRRRPEAARLVGRAAPLAFALAALLVLVVSIGDRTGCGVLRDLRDSADVGFGTDGAGVAAFAASETPLGALAAAFAGPGFAALLHAMALVSAVGVVHRAPLGEQRPQRAAAPVPATAPRTRCSRTVRGSPAAAASPPRPARSPTLR